MNCYEVPHIEIKNPLTHTFAQSSKEENYILNTGTHTYLCDRAWIDETIKIGKESTKGKHAIIAVEKDKTIILLSQPHKTPKQLGKSMAEYVSRGFKVYTA
jgi:hypothetical protein